MRTIFATKSFGENIKLWVMDENRTVTLFQKVFIKKKIVLK